MSYSTAQIRASFNRPLVVGYSGPLARISVDAVENDYSSITEFNTLKGTSTAFLVGIYDQVSGELITPTSTTDVIEEIGASGLLGWKSLGVENFLNSPAAIRSAFVSNNGWSATIVQLGEVTVGKSVEVIRTGQTTGTRLFLKSVNSEFIGKTELAYGGRRLDAQTTKVIPCGNSEGGYFIGTASVDFTTAASFYCTDGGIVKTNDNFQTLGAGDPGIPANIRWGNSQDSYISEFGMWTDALTEAQAEVVDSDQRAFYADAVEQFQRIPDYVFSWWQNAVAVTKNNILTTGGASSTAAQVVYERNATTGGILDSKVLQYGQYPQDDHNAISLSHLSNGELLCHWTGHGVDSLGNVDNSFYYSQSPTGRIADLSTPIKYNPTEINKSNYMIIMEDDAGQVVTATNDDATAAWHMFYRDVDNSWITNKRPMVDFGTDGSGGSAQAQLYMDGRFADGLCQLFSHVHPSNIQNSIRYSTLNVATGDYATGTGSLGTINTVSAFALTGHQNLSAIYTPPAGRSCRLLDIAEDANRIGFCEWDSADAANSVYNMLTYNGTGDKSDSANWTLKQVFGFPSNTYIWLPSRYPAGMSFARDYITNIGVYIGYYTGTQWRFSILVSDDDGDTWTETVIDNLTSPNEAVRIYSPKDCVKGQINAVYNVGPYTTFTDFLTYQDTAQFNDDPDPNTKPSVTINAPATLTVNGTAQLGATITDPDVGDTHTYAWTVSAGSLSSATSATPTFTAPATSQTVTFGLVVNDGTVDSDQATATTDILAETSSYTSSFTNMPNGTYPSRIIDVDNVGILFFGQKTYSNGVTEFTGLTAPAGTNIEISTLGTTKGGLKRGVTV